MTEFNTENNNNDILARASVEGGEDAAPEVPGAENGISNDPLEYCECGLTIDECNAQGDDFELTPEGLEYIQSAVDAISGFEDALVEEQEERRDALALLGTALASLASATEIYADLVAAEYGED